MHDCEINEWVQGLNKSAKAPRAWHILLGSTDKLSPRYNYIPLKFRNAI